MGKKEFPPIEVDEKSRIEYFADLLTGKQVKREKQDIDNMHKYMGIVRKIDNETLQLSTPAGGDRGQQDLIAGACRLAFETGKAVSLETFTEPHFGTVTTEMAKTVLSNIAMSFPGEMYGERVSEGKPSNETLNYCATCVIAIMNSYSDDARFYDSIMSGKEIRERFEKLQEDFQQKL